jgi:hypothetical protein
MIPSKLARGVSRAALTVTLGLGIVVSPLATDPAAAICSDGNTYVRNPRTISNLTDASRVSPYIVTGWGPGTLTLQKAVSVANGYTASTDVRAGWVSAAVGYSVTETNTTSVSYSINIPAGQHKGIVAARVYTRKSFELWKNCDGPIYDERQVGTGTSKKFSHFEYQQYVIK